MNRFIFGCSLVCVTFLLATPYLFPENSILWLASTSVDYAIFRASMILVLLTIMFSSPPRHFYTRVALGTLAVGLVGYGLSLSLSDSMHLLDITLFFALGFSFGIEALELNEAELEQKVIDIRQEYTERLAASAQRQATWSTVLLSSLRETAFGALPSKATS